MPFKKMLSDIAQKIGVTAGKVSSAPIHEATKETFQGMDLFRQCAEKKANVPFDQSKGNLFEYIEAVKYNHNAAASRNVHRAIVTDSIGRPHDPVDIEIVNQRGEVVRNVQAKFSDSQHAAVDSVFMQKNDKYKGMQRLIRKDEKYYENPDTGETSSLLQRSQELASKRANSEGSIYQEQYRDVAENLTDELHHDGVSSGGTTLEEVREAHNDPVKYAAQFERKRILTEMTHTAANMAVASMISTGITSSIMNMFAAYQNEKTLGEALSSIGVEVVESGAKSAATGALGVAIQSAGLKACSALLSDSLASTVIAGGIIDGGVALYSYAKGDINGEQLLDDLVDTTVKTSATIFYTKAAVAILGKSVAPIVPMAIYTTASYVVTCTREILRQAELNEQEYTRMTAILQEQTRSMHESRREFEAYLSQCEAEQRKLLDSLLDNFNYNIETGENYDWAILSIVRFANQAGIALQHVRFEEFSEGMQSSTPFRLG